ncbi:MAG: hypothetical protein RR778_01445, partial [Glutamicibacter sp.]|uniref:hypothetical protein n=1 Tax=Glutamicibacter sp. TaxID=1931995 RepID=UPI002FC74C88
LSFAVFFCSLVTDPLCIMPSDLQMIDSVGIQQKLNLHGYDLLLWGLRKFERQQRSLRFRVWLY